MFGRGLNTGNEGRAALDDGALARAARSGDKRAFVEIVSRHQAMICGIALAIVGDFATSEDVAQEAFLTAWKKMEELREPERVRAWLAQIARNAALAHLRRNRSHSALEEAGEFADPALRPDEAAANDEETALVREVLANLPETYRLPMILFYREGHSVRAVSEALGLTEDAVKQRLARGREMLRDRMAGLVETVLRQTAPKASFTIAIAVAIGALAAPTAVAGAVFAASAASGTAASASTSSLFTAMSTTKASLIGAALVAVVFVPVGYKLGAPVPARAAHSTELQEPIPTVRSGLTNRPFDFSGSAMFAEWRNLHELHGTTAEAMPEIYKAIAGMKDAFRRRAFRSALIAEWVQLDPASGLKFLLGQKNDTSVQRQFFEEWLALNPTNAVAALLSSGDRWQGLARDCLSEIARRVPGRVPEIALQLPKAENDYWDTKVRDAFAIIAEGNATWAREAAEKMTGANREQALAGVAKAWARSDLTSAMTWARGLPDGVDRDEVIRAALLGKAGVDPAAALDLIGSVPAGGRSGYFATSTGARVLSEAAKTDFDGTVAWVAAHPGRLGYEDMMGLANPVTQRLNADPIAFLNRLASEGTLSALNPAIGSAILNESGGQRAAIWEWLKTQPQNEATASLRGQVLSSAGYQDPALALKLAADLPRTKEGDQDLRSLASSLFNGGQQLSRFDKLVEQAPERFRGPLVEAAFQFLRGDTFSEPQTWVDRLSMLPDAKKGTAINTIAAAWGGQSPEAAMAWARALPDENTRNAAISRVTESWAANDPVSAATWVSSLAPGAQRDSGAAALAERIAGRHASEAWEWAMTIGDPALRDTAAMNVVQQIAFKDRTAAQQFVQSAAVTPELRGRLQAIIDRRPAGVKQ